MEKPADQRTTRPPPRDSPFLKPHPSPAMRCVTFQGKASMMKMPGWVSESMADAQEKALGFINSTHGIEIAIIETTLAEHCAIITVWYRTPFLKGEKSSQDGNFTENEW